MLKCYHQSCLLFSGSAEFSMLQLSNLVLPEILISNSKVHRVFRLTIRSCSHFLVELLTREKPL